MKEAKGNEKEMIDYVDKFKNRTLQKTKKKTKIANEKKKLKRIEWGHQYSIFFIRKIAETVAFASSYSL